MYFVLQVLIDLLASDDGMKCAKMMAMCHRIKGVRGNTPLLVTCPTFMTLSLQDFDTELKTRREADTHLYIIKYPLAYHPVHSCIAVLLLDCTAAGES